jgi:anti-sigma factor RsiW
MNSFCDEARENFAPYLKGRLPASAAARLQEHLASCSNCEAALAEDRMLVESMAFAQAPLNAEFNQAVLARAAAWQNAPRRIMARRLFALPWPASMLGMLASLILCALLYTAAPVFSWRELVLSLFSLQPLLVVAALWLTFFVVRVNEKYLEQLLYSSSNQPRRERR